MILIRLLHVNVSLYGNDIIWYLVYGPLDINYWNWNSKQAAQLISSSTQLSVPDKYLFTSIHKHMYIPVKQGICSIHTHFT